MLNEIDEELTHTSRHKVIKDFTFSVICGRGGGLVRKMENVALWKQGSWLVNISDTFGQNILSLLNDYFEISLHHGLKHSEETFLNTQEVVADGEVMVKSQRLIGALISALNESELNPFQGTTEVEEVDYK